MLKHAKWTMTTIGAVGALVLAIFWAEQAVFCPYARYPAAQMDYYNLLVRGFQAGTLSLAKPVPAGLQQAGNPYDPEVSKEYWDEGILDLSLFHGRFFIYFGLTPVLVLFWPFATVTGHLFPQYLAVFVFASLGFAFSAVIAIDAWRRYFPRAWLGTLGLCLVALGLATGVPALMIRSNIYEVAITCGYAMCSIALYAFWRSWHDPQRGQWWLALASASFGLAVGARPSLAPGVIALLLPIIAAWRARRSWLSVGIAAALPVGVIGIGLMVYNQARFGSPFEFGMRYQLNGGLDFNAGAKLLGTNFLGINFCNYFLGPLRWSWVFPFVRALAFPYKDPIGYLGVQNAFGIACNVPIAWFVFAAFWCPKSPPLANPSRYFLGTVVMMAGGTILFVNCFASACGRYQVDFLPVLILLAALGVLRLDDAISRATVAAKMVVRSFVCLLVLLSAAFNLLVGFAPWSDYQRDLHGLGAGMLAGGQAADAEQFLALCNRLNPNDPQALEAEGRALLRLGRPADAVAPLARACWIDEHFAQAHNNLGIALERTGRLAGARHQFQAAIRAQADYAPAQANLEAVSRKLEQLPP
jgi:hypothetical protein